jgi:hypothetical protein
MNRNEIADQVRVTLGDHVADFDVEAIVDDLAASNGEAMSVDDFDSESYWAIVESRDITAPKGA